MTDPRAVAITLVQRFGDSSDCTMTVFDKTWLIGHLAEALADERRTALEEAAKHLEQSVSLYDGEEDRLTISVFAKCEAEWLRTQAHASQEVNP